MKKYLLTPLKTLSAVAVLCFAIAAWAATPEIELIIKDHLFFPAILEIPAGQKVRVRIINQDPTPEEFESFELNREKLVIGNGQTVIFIGPLEPGEYPFFGEFYPKTAQGVVIVK
ncbi:MAG: cupredoxin domain-containing protein [Gammaproteobacteria bacterium]|nr:cupredoxin domain-containing protein [Gammaproteobacteria bacterium]MBL4890361.1 cupredoxin domain-containing protein [Rhizobiaceae bacterium]